MKKQFYVYIMASKPNGTLYIGVTSNLLKRVFEHKSGLVDGFTKKYMVKDLVYFEVVCEAVEAIKREKQPKSFRRKWKIELIEECNSVWRDLYEEISK